MGGIIEGAGLLLAEFGTEAAAVGGAEAAADVGAVTAAEAAAGEITTTAALSGGIGAGEAAAALGLGGAALGLDAASGASAAVPGGLTGSASTGANVPASGNAVGGATTTGTGVPGTAPGGTPITGTGGTSAAATAGPGGANAAPVDLSQITTSPIGDTTGTGGLSTGGGATFSASPGDALGSLNGTASATLPAAGAPAAAAPSSLSQLGTAISSGNVGNIAGAAGNVITSNPATALGALGLGYDAIKSGQAPKGTNQLTSQANQLATQGSQLESALNGPLPAGAQAALSQASNSSKAALRSRYASLGLSGSTMEADALANVDQTVAAQGFQIADQLYQQGVSETNMSAQLFEQIMQIQAGQNNALTGAIGNFAGALAGSGLKSGG